MRLDKYLKITRLIKRRTIANEACDVGKVLVNQVAARASYQVKVDDIIEIRLGAKTLRVRVTEIPSHVTKQTASEYYALLES